MYFHFMDTLRGFFWSLFLRFMGARVGASLRVHGNLEILLRDGATYKNLSIGDNVTFAGNMYIRIRHHGRIEIGDNVRTGHEVWLVTAKESTLSVGRNTILGTYTIFNGGYGIRIGEDCLCAAYVYVNSSDHRFDSMDKIQSLGHVGAPIEIGNDVWLCGKSVVTKGVKIGTGAVIGAGAVVTRDIPSYQVAVGVPARPIKDRREMTKEVQHP